MKLQACLPVLWTREGQATALPVQGILQGALAAELQNHPRFRHLTLCSISTLQLLLSMTLHAASHLLCPPVAQLAPTTALTPFTSKRLTTAALMKSKTAEECMLTHSREVWGQTWAETDLSHSGVELVGMDDVWVSQVNAEHGLQGLQGNVAVVPSCMQRLHHLCTFVCQSGLEHEPATGSIEVSMHTHVWADATSMASLWSNAGTCTLSRGLGCLILQNAHSQITDLSKCYHKANKAQHVTFADNSCFISVDQCKGCQIRMVCTCCNEECRDVVLTLTATVAPFQVPLYTCPEPPCPSRGPRFTAVKGSVSTMVPGMGGKCTGDASSLLIMEQPLLLRLLTGLFGSCIVAK